MKKIYLLAIVFLLIPLVHARWELGAPELQITTSYEPIPAEPGKYVRIYIDAYNSGAETENNVWFKLEADYPFSIKDNLKYYGKISSLEKVTLSYDVWVDADAKEADYDNKIKLRQCYDKECSYGPYTEIPISVSKLHPILEVSDIQVDNAIIPGEKTQVKLILANKGGARLKDIDVQLDLSSNDLPIAPIGDSTEKIIQSIDKNEKGEIVYDLIVDGDADSGVYKIPITISYYDNRGTKYTKEDILGLVVGGKPNLKVGLEKADYLSPGSIGDITFNIVNEGSSDAKFLSIKLLPLKDYEIISPDNIYIGNLNPDDYETAEFKIKISKTKKDSISIPVQIIYTDVSNAKYIDDQEVKLNLYSSSEIKKIEGKNSKLSWIILVIIATIIGLIYYKKRPFKHK